jgi:Fe-S cluster assembly protein SufD
MMGVAAAIAARDADLLPSRRDEDWRWTGLRELIRVVPPASPAAKDIAPNPILATLGWPTLVFANGRPLEEGEIAIPATGKGAYIRRFVSASAETAHHLTADVSVGEGGRLSLIDSFEGCASDYLANAALTLRLAPGAHVERIVLLDDAEDAVSVACTDVELAPGARFSQTVLASGARRQRFETHLIHPGDGASIRLDGAYVLAGKRHSDQTSVVAHAGEGGVTSQLTKGVASDQARGVFQGRIVVQRGADGTDARMAHHALLLSDRAEIDAKPELEIYADDVSCAHGNTVGALSDEAIFYARSRGIPEAAARVMLTAAFLGEVVERIENQPAREIARAWVEARLEALV